MEKFSSDFYLNFKSSFSLIGIKEKFGIEDLIDELVCNLLNRIWIPDKNLVFRINNGEAYHSISSNIWVNMNCDNVP
jgi:hypothetical protein